MADITVNYNKNILQATLEVLNSSNLKKIARPGMKVSIKPNMVLAKPPSQGATTHNEVVEGLIIFFKELGISNIEIIESAWIGGDTKKAYHICGYDKLCKKYGVSLFDLKDDATCRIDMDKYQFEICRKALETDCLINVPVLKAHCQTLMTCNLKNMKGCISDSEKRRFHSLGLHGPIAYLNKAIKTHFCLVDGICGDLTFEEGGNPVTRNMILAGSDPLLLDSYCAGLLGYEVSQIEYLNIASKLNIGRIFTSDIDILELNKNNKPKFTCADRGIAGKLSTHINEDKACSACYSALISALYQVKGFSIEDKINIGQGFKGKSGKIGCGNCANGCDNFVKGCPPKAVDVVKFLNWYK